MSIRKKLSRFSNRCCRKISPALLHPGRNELDKATGIRVTIAELLWAHVAWKVTATLGSRKWLVQLHFDPYNRGCNFRRGCNSVGRVAASQAACRAFESRHPLLRTANDRTCHWLFSFDMVKTYDVSRVAFLFDRSTVALVSSCPRFTRIAGSWCKRWCKRNRRAAIGPSQLGCDAFAFRVIVER